MGPPNPGLTDLAQAQAQLQSLPDILRCVVITECQQLRCNIYMLCVQPKTKAKPSQVVLSLLVMGEVGRFM